MSDKTGEVEADEVARARKMVLYCTACGKPIHPRDVGAVRLLCPKCEKETIIRCSKCRKIGNIARCPSCGFEFP